MSRTSKRVSAATRETARAPTFSVWGNGGGGLTGQLFDTLRGTELVRELMLMAEQDETVGAMLYCISTTIRQITWPYVPQIDGVDAPDDPEAKKWAEMMDGMSYDMSRSFAEHIEDALTMLPVGFAAIEIVMKQRNGSNSRFTDGFYGIDKLNLLDQSTIYDWVYDGTDLVGMRQYAWSATPGKNQVIPLDKTLHYRLSAQYNNPRGRPLMKNALRVWKLKKKIQDSEALGIERELVGLPIFEIPEDVIRQQFDLGPDGKPTDQARLAQGMVAAAQSAVTDLRLNKTGGLVLPSDTWGDEYQGGASARRYNFRIQTTGGQRSIDSRTAARDYDHAIARVAMMQFLTLGQRSGGSYGLSEDQSSMAVASIMAIADAIVQEWNLKAIPMVWDVNAWPLKYRPRLRHSDVNKNGIVQLGQFLAGVGKAAELWGGDSKMRIALAKAANLPYDAAAQGEAAETHQKQADLAATAPPPPTGAKPAAPDDSED